MRHHAHHLLLGLLCSSAGAQAITTDALFEMPLESLMQLRVSVASPYQETVTDVASSVAVLEPSDWQRRGARSVEEALEQVPGVVSFHALGGARATAVRGFATNLSVRDIATRLDGVPLNNLSYATAVYDTPFFPLALLGRIEMIRGPASTLYGSDAIHGVIALDTYYPDDQVNQAQFALGTQDDGVLAWLGSHSPAQGLRASAGLAATHHGDRDLTYSYSDPITGAPARGVRDHHEHDAAGFLHLEVGSPEEGRGLWRLSLYGDDYQGRDFPGVGTQIYQGLQGYFQLANLNLDQDRDVSDQESDFWLAQLKHLQRLPAELELELQAYQWQSEQTWNFDLRRAPLTLTATDGTVVPCRTDTSQIGVLPLFCPHQAIQGTAERRRGLQALLRQTEPRGNHQWAVGLGQDWLQVRKAFLRRVADDGQVYMDIHNPFEGADRKIAYLFFHARSDWWQEQLALVYGLRLDDYSDVGTTTSPRLGLIYSPSGDWTGKLLYGRAFRAPTAAERFGAGTGSAQRPNPGIQPESKDTLELVAQHQALSHSSEVVWFYGRWVDGILFQPVDLQYQNVGKNRSYGLELSHRHQFGAWRLEGNATYVYSANENPPSSSGHTRLEYSAFPRYTLNLGLGRGFGPWEVWLNERAMLHRSESDTIADQPTHAAPDYYRTDLHFGWQRPGYRCGLDVRNLFDKRHNTAALYNAEGGLPDERRSLRLSLERSL